MSRDISWIDQIVNNSDRAFIIWCWDTDNEGEYRIGDRVIGKNDGGARVTIAPRTTLYCGGCGVPDGGDRDGFPKARVICEASKAERAAPNHAHGDPRRGLQLNRYAAGDDRDRISLRDRATQREVGAFSFPRGFEQNLILRIEDDGIFLEVTEEQVSTEWKAYLVGQQLGDLAIELSKIAFEVALGAAMA